MTKLLYIEASPRKERSHSIAVAEAFLDSYRQANANHEIDRLDLWDIELPEFSGALIDAKYRIFAGESHTRRESDAWQAVVERFNRLNAADKVVFSLPMWNFGIPYKLKHLIDIVSQPSLAFAITESGYEGLVKGKPAMLICARGGEYPPGTEFAKMDFQKTYLEFILGFIGFEDIRSIVVDPMLSPPDEAHAIQAKKCEEARAAALSF